jgi:hypothetical protein
MGRSRPPFLIAATIVLVPIIASCGGGGMDPDRSPSAGPPANAALVGPPIAAPVATAVDFTVKVTDATGAVVPNHVASFVVTASRGRGIVPSG